MNNNYFNRLIHFVTNDGRKGEKFCNESHVDGWCYLFKTWYWKVTTIEEV